MGDGSRLAIAILVLFLAMVAFFFAFHPNGVVDSSGNPLNNPDDILKWMFGEFDKTVTGSTSVPTKTPQGDKGVTPTSKGSGNASP